MGEGIYVHVNGNKFLVPPGQAARSPIYFEILTYNY